MFNVITGPYHPTLEASLVQDIQHLKSVDPLAPIAIVVPSAPLRQRLRWLLCAEHQNSLFDVSFLTFHQLALRLHREQILFNQGESGLQFTLVHDLCFEHLLNFLWRKHGRAFEGLTPSRITTGTHKVLWRTIRDLKEAMVDPEITLQGVQEGLFGEDEGKRLQDLFAVYALVQEASLTLKIGSADDLAALMIPWVEHSPFLSRVTRVCYYGFYDLTQVQLSLFEVIAAKSQVTVYFPLSDGPAFSFARRFFERHLCTGGQSTQGQGNRSAAFTVHPGNNGGPNVTVMHTVGPEDELSAVCKEIIQLVEQHHYHFDDIGVVARNIEPYQFSLRRTFEQHRIPFTSSAMTPLIQEPLAKHLLQLAKLPLTDFFWGDVLDVLTSPFYRLERFGMVRDELQPEQFHQIVRTFGIHGGQDQWSRLTSHWKEGERQGGHPMPTQGQIHGPPIDVQHIQLLDRFVRELIADCQGLPTQGTVSELTQAFLSMARTHMALPGFMEFSCEPLSDIPHMAVLAKGIEEVLTVLKEMQVVNEIVTWEQWTQIFYEAVNVCPIAMASTQHSGVRVLDVMSARGLPFQALFLIGLNEKIFPRFIREDAFLRDRSRRVLEETFGYKIDEKLAGYDEEQLLFALLTQAARQRFYLVYQRADKEGRSLAPSPFVTDHQSPIHELNPCQEIMVPRRLSDRFNHPVFDPSFLSWEELSLKLILQEYHPRGLLEKAGREPQLFNDGWESLQALERHRGPLGPYDGMINSPHRYWEECARKGVTPTSLEVYARCPFQFFATRVLRVHSGRAAMLNELSPSSLGDLCHAILHQTYRQLVEHGWPEHESSLLSLRQKVVTVSDEMFNQYAANKATGYFLTWQIAKDIIVELVTSAVEADSLAYRQEGLRPMAFEVDAVGQLTRLGSPFAHIKIRGRLDRVDVRDDPPSLRIVDYKFQPGVKMRSQDRDLLLSGIRGSHLQPSVYALMNHFDDQRLNVANDGQGLHPDAVDFIFLAPRWKTQVIRSEFSAEFWKGASGRQLRHTLRQLLTGVQSGQFFILPGDYCRHCEISTACRRFHRPTWVRSYGSSQARQLRQLRTQDLHND